MDNLLRQLNKTLAFSNHIITEHEKIESWKNLDTFQRNKSNRSGFSHPPFRLCRRTRKRARVHVSQYASVQPWTL